MSNPEKGVAPSPTPWCSSYRKGSLRVSLDYGRQLYFTYFIVINTKFRPMFPLIFIRCFMSNSEIYPKSRTEPFIWTTMVDCPNLINHDRIQVFSYSKCCLLTLDQAVYQILPETERNWLNKRKQSRGWSEVEDVMKWYKQMPRESLLDSWGQLEDVWVKPSLQSLRAPVGVAAHRASGWVPRLRSWRSTKWSLENDISWCGQRKRSYGSI